MKDNLRKRFGFLLLSLVICVGITAMPKAVFAADTDIYWGIDDNNKMWISHNPLSAEKRSRKCGTGKWPCGGTLTDSDSDMNAVLEVEFMNKIVAPEKCTNLFYGFSDLQLIKGIKYLDTSKVEYMNSMFGRCESLETLDLSSFDTSNVRYMFMMFANCKSLETLDASSFNTSNVSTMGGMFSDCISLKSLNVCNFNTSKAHIASMFSGCKSLKTLNISNINTSGTKSLSYIFSGCKSLESIDLRKFNTSSVTEMKGMFRSCEQLETIDLSNFNTSNVTNMRELFYGCKALKSFTFDNIDTSKVSEMSFMFADCESLESLNLDNLNTSNVVEASWMFKGCSSLKSLDLSRFTTSKMEEASYMFYDCNSLEALDLSGLDVSRVKDGKLKNMLNFCPSYYGTVKIRSLTLQKRLNELLPDTNLSISGGSEGTWYVKNSKDVNGDYDLSGYYLKGNNNTRASEMAALELTGDTITYVAIDQLPVISGEDTEVEYDTSLQEVVRDYYSATDKDGNPVDIIVREDGGYNQQNAGKYSVTIAAVDSEGYESIKTVSITVKAKVCSPGEHQMIAIPEKAATCSAPGYKAYWKCEVCNKTFLDENGDTPAQNLITPKVAHEYGNWTKLDDKQHQRVCLHDNAHIEKANHAWDAGKVTRKATTTATGIKTYTCTVCKATKNANIAKLPKKTNPLAVKGKTATLKYKKLKKKAQTLSVSKAITFTKKGQGAITYTKASGNKKIIINKKNGKITVKKGLKKGTYKVKVKVAAAGNNNYKATVKTITVTIKVK